MYLCTKEIPNMPHEIITAFKAFACLDLIHPVVYNYNCNFILYSSLISIS